MKVKIILIILLLILIIFSIIITFSSYRKIFTGGYSEKQEIWGSFGDYIGGVLGPFFTLISIILVIWTIYETNKNFKEEIAYNSLYELMKEYRSKKMGEDLNILYNFRDKLKRKKNNCIIKEFLCKNTDKKNINNNITDYENNNLEYIKKMQLKYKNKEYKHKTKVYYARRNVSHFYQQVAIFLKKKKIFDELVFDIWSKEVLKIIPEIIIPLESFDESNTNKLTKYDLLNDFYNKSVKFEEKKFFMKSILKLMYFIFLNSKLMSHLKNSK